MTTTVSVSKNGELLLPERFRRRKRIKPGTPLRVTEVGDGLYVSAVPDPTERELKAVISAAGSLSHEQTSDDERMVTEEIAAYRRSKRGRNE